MPAKSIVRSTFSTVRISLALLLTAVLVFPDAAMAQSCTSTAWTPFPSSSMLPNAIETLNAVVNNGYLYVVGGSTGTTGFQSTVSYVQLSTTTGMPLTAFKSTTPLPVALSRDLCGVAYNGFLYTVGGVEFSSTDSNGQTVGYVQYAPFHPATGTIGNWTTQTQAQTTLPAVQLHGAVVLNGYMYVIGGSTGTDASQSQVTGNITDAVYYAKINSDGSVQPFKPASLSLPIPLYKTCPVAVGNTIYVPGGETDQAHEVIPGDPAVNTVYYAIPNPTTGDIDSWPTATNLPHIDAAQAVAYVNTKGILLMGGDQSGNGMDRPTVYEGVINGTNRASVTWNTLPALSANVSRNAGATLNHYAYSVAGLVAGSDSKGVNCLLIQ